MIPQGEAPQTEGTASARTLGLDDTLDVRETAGQRGWGE